MYTGHRARLSPARVYEIHRNNVCISRCYMGTDRFVKYIITITYCRVRYMRVYNIAVENVSNPAGEKNSI